MDPEVEALLPTIEADTAGRLAAFERDVNEVRRARLQQAEATQRQGAQLALQEDRLIPGAEGLIPVRIFVPEAPVGGAYLHIHGGGWALGAETTQDPMLRGIAAGAGVVVVSVGYRLAPEHPYPAGLDDCVAAAHWFAANVHALGGEMTRLAIGGESAGANLAVATLLRLRDDGTRPFQAAVLTYGVYSALLDLPSVRRLWDRNIVLSGPIMEWFVRAYAAGQDLRNPYISPLFADLTGMPPAIFSVGTLDHLYSDTEEMAKRWLEAGNEAVVHVYEDGPHGFNLFPQLAMARVSNERVVAFLRERVGVGAATVAG